MLLQIPRVWYFFGAALPNSRVSHGNLVLKAPRSLQGGWDPLQQGAGPIVTSRWRPCLQASPFQLFWVRLGPGWGGSVPERPALGAGLVVTGLAVSPAEPRSFAFLQKRLRRG